MWATADGMILMVQENGPKPMSEGWLNGIEIVFVVLNLSVLAHPFWQVWMDSMVRCPETRNPNLNPQL